MKFLQFFITVQFIIKELANEFQGQIEKAKKYETFSVPIEKEVTKIDKDGNERVLTTS